MPRDHLKREVPLGAYVKVQTRHGAPVCRARVETVYRWSGPLKGTVLLRFANGTGQYMHPDDLTMFLLDECPRCHNNPLESTAWLLCGSCADEQAEEELNSE